MVKGLKQKVTVGRRYKLKSIENFLIKRWGKTGKGSTCNIKGIHDKRNLSVDVDDMYKLERQILASFKSMNL